MLAYLLTLASLCAATNQCLNGPCYPGNEYCGAPYENAPVFHLMNQHGCSENDPNGPVFDPVHGVIHHFYQNHVATGKGHGPDYGHFVSKDFVTWATVPMAIWNGLDSSVWPPKVTPYDTVAIYTGSATVLDGMGPNGQPGIVNLYPGLCTKDEWKNCKSGTLLAMAVPADYSDELLLNWTKPSFNPIMENTQRDPSSPWKTPHGEWRLRTYDSKVYGSASDADFRAGKWYEIGTNTDLRTCECPSLYPLPGPTPGTEAEYESMKDSLPSHVHKTSCDGDWWQLGTYTPGAPKVLGTFKATPGWENAFAQKRIDMGAFYASKDNIYPTASGGERRINWGWAQVRPGSAQTFPREITFNAPAGTLQQYPIEELTALRGKAAYINDSVPLKAAATLDLGIPASVVKQSEIVAVFELPSIAANLTVSFDAPTGHVATYMENTDMPGGDYNITHYNPADAPKCEAACKADPKCKAWTMVVRGAPAGSGDCCLKSSVPCPGPQSTCTSGAKVAQELPECGDLVCTVQYTPAPADSTASYDVPVHCGPVHDTLRLLKTETTVELRVFYDWTFIEAFFQQGRVAMTVNTAGADAIGVSATEDVVVAKLAVFPVKSIWVHPEAVRAQARVFP